MIAVEPPETPYDVKFSFGSVPVRIHPLFWIVAVMLGRPFDPNVRPVHVLIWVIAIFISVVIHEFGHVVAFRRYGIASHVVLYAMGGLAIPDGYARTSSNANILIALAGPIAGFLLAAALLLGLWLGGHELWVVQGPAIFFVMISPFEPDNLYTLIFNLVQINIFLGLLNLLPIFPLDGGRVSRELFNRFGSGDPMRQSLTLSMIVAAVVAVIAVTQWGSFWIALMFGYLAYMNYDLMQKISGRGSPW